MKLLRVMGNVHYKGCLINCIRCILMLLSQCCSSATINSHTIEIQITAQEVSCKRKKLNFALKKGD